MSLESMVHLRAELPPLGKYTIGSDFAKILIEEILSKQPQFIVEAGSGVSTVLASYCLEQLGGGSLLSLEHLPEYVDQTNKMLYRHNLNKLNVNVHFAPLCNYTIMGETFRWYSMKELERLPRIDMLIVDGPPRPTGKFARYPILPLLYNVLSPSATIILDDADRADEQEALARWLNEYKEFKITRFVTQKGAALLYRM